MLPDGYQLRVGSGKDRALLVKFMDLTYQELFPEQQNFAHLAETVEKYFCSQTPLWFIETIVNTQKTVFPVACLWLGDGIDQIKGDRYTYIFLLYVIPKHRRQGIGTALMNLAQKEAVSRGDRQIGLHVFQNNQAALKLYHHLGYQTQSLLMIKSLVKE